MTPASSDPHAMHRSALVLDGHADTPQRFLDEGWSFADPAGTGMLSLDTARAGNLAGELFAIWVEPEQWRGRFAHRALALLDAVHEQVRRHPDSLQLCTTPDEVLAAHAHGRFAVMLSVEGGHAIENDLGLLRTFFRLGVRSMTLTWANTNEWADSSGDLDDPQVPHHGGLTGFGREVIHEMNRLGMMVDVSHVSDATFRDVLETSRAPVFASHSSARAVTPAPRNLTDPMLRAIASRGGLAMANFYQGFVDDAWRLAWAAQKPERHAAHAALQQQYGSEPVPFAASNRIDREFAERLPRAPFNALVDHLEHMISVAGVDHVGLGSDFDGIPLPPQGMDSAADLPRITEALASHGHTAEDVHKILGGNFLRVFRAVQDAATS